LLVQVTGFKGLNVNLCRPEKASKLVWIIFGKLRHLDEGNYLLSHRSNDFNIAIYEANNDMKEYELHAAHKSSPITDTTIVPYIPIRWAATNSNQIPDTFPINKYHSFGFI
jgi:hypothetical protein